MGRLSVYKILCTNLQWFSRYLCNTGAGCSLATVLFLSVEFRKSSTAIENADEGKHLRLSLER